MHHDLRIPVRFSLTMPSDGLAAEEKRNSVPWSALQRWLNRVRRIEGVGDDNGFGLYKVACLNPVCSLIGFPAIAMLAQHLTVLFDCLATLRPRGDVVGLHVRHLKLLRA